jgi:tetratricopeptide (TPR) repeat protein
VYEKSGQLEKAEAEYVVAATDGTVDIRSQALANLQRLLQFTTNRNLQIAQTYEHQEQWSQAEAYFLKAAESAQIQVDHQTALEGIERIRQKSISPWDPLLEQTEWMPKAGTFLLRLIGPVVLLLAILRFCVALRAVSRSTKIWPFEGDEQLSKVIQSAFPSVRAKAYSAVGPFNAIKLPQTLTTVYPFVPLHLGDLPDEAIEMGELKIPSLASLLQVLVRPRLEVEGGISTSDSGSFVYAHVWRNRWFRTRLQTVATTNIPKPDANGAALELFIYDVYLKTLRTMGRHEFS